MLEIRVSREVCREGGYHRKWQCSREAPWSSMLYCCTAVRVREAPWSLTCCTGEGGAMEPHLLYG
jgi:hypothetical protein